MTPHHAEPDRELLLELSARMFGAEVSWFSLHHNAQDAAKELFDNTFDLIDKVVKKAKDFDVSTRITLFYQIFLFALVQLLIFFSLHSLILLLVIRLQDEKRCTDKVSYSEILMVFKCNDVKKSLGQA